MCCAENTPFAFQSDQPVRIDANAIPTDADSQASNRNGCFAVSVADMCSLPKKPLKGEMPAMGRSYCTGASCHRKEKGSARGWQVAPRAACSGSQGPNHQGAKRAAPVSLMPQARKVWALSPRSESEARPAPQRETTGARLAQAQEGLQAKARRTMSSAAE
jgi:hypothetical protein